MTDVNSIIRLVQQQLSQADIASADHEAATIVAHNLNVTKGELGAMQILGKSVDQATIQQIIEMAQARATRTPLQYLLGHTGFYGLELTVKPGVFIPRPETEILVEYTLSELTTGHKSPLKVLDLCTGTGAIAIALADQLAQKDTPAQVWAIDISETAVELAQHNARNHQVTVLQADATNTASIVQADPGLKHQLGQFDVVVSNPPYIPVTTPVTQHEALQDPDTALYGGSDDGTLIPKQIAAQALEWLAPGGFFMMEHDHTHATQLVHHLAEHPGWSNVTTINDLTETPRFLVANRTEWTQRIPENDSTLAQ